MIAAHANNFTNLEAGITHHCPCHLPITLSALALILGGTAAGALLRAHPYVAGAVVTTLWVAGPYDWPNFHLFDTRRYGRFQGTNTAMNCDPYKPHALGAGGMFVLLGDGSVRSVNNGMSDATFLAACVPNDGAVLGADW